VPTRLATPASLLEALEPLCRQEVSTGQAGADDEPTSLHDQLNPVQRRLLKLPNLDPNT